MISLQSPCETTDTGTGHKSMSNIAKKETTGHHVPPGGLLVMKYSCHKKQKVPKPLNLKQIKLLGLNSHLQERMRTGEQDKHHQENATAYPE